jgi:hypothetical protein
VRSTKSVPRRILRESCSSRRHRLHDNLLGTRRFCSIVRRTRELTNFNEQKIKLVKVAGETSSLRATRDKNNRRSWRPSSQVCSLQSGTYSGNVNPWRRITYDGNSPGFRLEGSTAHVVLGRGRRRAAPTSGPGSGSGPTRLAPGQGGAPPVEGLPEKP